MDLEENNFTEQGTTVNGMELFRIYIIFFFLQNPVIP